MSERFFDSQHNRDALDRHITGNHGEDQFKNWVPVTGDTVTVEHYPGIAFRVDGYETQPDENTIWTGIEEETGRVKCHMIGDDRPFTFEPEELTPIDDDDYCPECGQLGRGHYRGDDDE
jgi:hypothetical protein